MSTKVTTSTIHIIDNQSDFIIVNKPAGKSFHDEGEVDSGFFNEVKNALNTNNINQKFPDEIEALYPVHRLDKMTSGLIVFAKNKVTATLFQQLFEQHKIQKFYLALSDKKPKKKQGLIKGDMAKSRRSAWKLLRTKNNPAISQFMSYGLGDGLRLYIVKPHSGKTHQIRVALSSIGSPIIGDLLYATGDSAIQYDRGYLHAYALQFTLNNSHYKYQLSPNSGEQFLTTSFIQQLKDIGEPWNLSWPCV